MIKERDSRKKNAEKLLDQVEKRNKELVEEHVKKELEIEELKRKCAEYLADLQRFKEDLVHQDELRKKREDQVQALLFQLKRKEQENARLSKELKRREEENKELNSSIQTLATKIEKETRLKMQKELDQVRGMAAAKEGEMRVVKEMIKSYHHQLKQKEGEVVRFRKKAEVRKPGGRLPPLESQSLGDNLPSKSSLKSKLSSQDFAKKHRSPKRLPDIDDDTALEQVMAQSQQALYAPQGKSPKREQLLTEVKHSFRASKEAKDDSGKEEETKARVGGFSDEDWIHGEPQKTEESKQDLRAKANASDEEWPRTEVPKETDYTRDEAGFHMSGEEGYNEGSEEARGEEFPPHGRGSEDANESEEPVENSAAQPNSSQKEVSDGLHPPVDTQFEEPQDQDLEDRYPQDEDPQYEEPHGQDVPGSEEGEIYPPAMQEDLSQHLESSEFPDASVTS